MDNVTNLRPMFCPYCEEPLHGDSIATATHPAKATRARDGQVCPWNHAARHEVRTSAVHVRDVRVGMLVDVYETGQVRPVIDRKVGRGEYLGWVQVTVQVGYGVTMSRWCRLDTVFHREEVAS